MLTRIEKLRTAQDNYFYLNYKALEPLKKELEEFLKDEKYMNGLDFSKKVMHSQEIKTNNNIEGYSDNIVFIEDVIKDSISINDEEKINRIINLYKGYQFILNRPEINKETLKELYDILSQNLLCSNDEEFMGKFYRNQSVFIFFSDNVQIPPDKGVDSSLLDDLMDNYLDFLNTDNNLETMTDYYIKSQIAHYYFIYLHPYFDINGRTARTTSMWYLLNNEAYPYVIFNRAIDNSKNIYYKEIRKVRKSNDLTSFINYLMASVKKEFEKEYVIQAIKGFVKGKLNSSEIATILDILSMNGLKSLKDFSYLYNLKNEKKKVKEIHSEMLLPLLEKKVITKVRDTKSGYDNDSKNYTFELNKEKLEIDPKKTRRLKL